jgi:hypothetical protein
MFLPRFELTTGTDFTVYNRTTLPFNLHGACRFRKERRRRRCVRPASARIRAALDQQEGVELLDLRVISGSISCMDVMLYSKQD